NLLKLHGRAGGHALLMSATLGAAARCRLLGLTDSEMPDLKQAVALPYPAISTSSSLRPKLYASRGIRRTVSLTLEKRIREFEAVVRMALAYARQGAKVLVVRNTHRDAVATAQALLAI